MHSAKEDAQCPRPGPIPNLLAVFSHAARTFVQVGELANFSCGVSVDCGVGRSDAGLVSAERSRRALTSFRFGVAERVLSASSPPIWIFPACRSCRRCCRPGRAPKMHLRMPDATGPAKQFQSTRAASCCLRISWRYRTCQRRALEGPVDARTGSIAPFRPCAGHFRYSSSCGHVAAPQ